MPSGGEKTKGIEKTKEKTKGINPICKDGRRNWTSPLFRIHRVRDRIKRVKRQQKNQGVSVSDGHFRLSWFLDGGCCFGYSGIAAMRKPDLKVP